MPALLLAALLTPTQPAASPPNVLFILADDLGFGDLACQGAADMRTPHVDGLFASGLTFDHFYANCPVCSPTRAALMSGRYPGFAGVPGVVRPWPEDNWGYLRPDLKLLPARLGDAGYRTALVGKWHLGGEPHNGVMNHPLDRGFDRFEGFLGGMLSDYNSHVRRFPGGEERNMMRSGRETVDPRGHATDLFSDWAVSYLRERGRERSRLGERRPFFLYLAYNAPHTPIQPPPDWAAKVKKREPGITDKRAKLVALIEHMDHGIGRVLEALDETGLSEETLVVFTSDNGGQLSAGANNGPLRGGKETVYEGGLRVPCAVRWPGVTTAGTRTGLRALTMDWFPTLLDAAGAEYDAAAFDARTLTPTLRGEAQAPLRDEWHFTRREGRPHVFGGKTIDAVIHDGWKLVQDDPFGPRELFHLADDPNETTDVAGENRAIFLDLAGRMQDRIRREGAVPWQAPVE